MVKRVLLLMVLMGLALALICGSKAPSSSSLIVIRDNEVGVVPAPLLGNSMKCGPAQTLMLGLLSLVDFTGMLPGHTSGVETVFFMGRLVCTLSSPSTVVCFGLSHPLSLRSSTCLRSSDCDRDFLRVAMKVSQGCFQDHGIKSSSSSVSSPCSRCALWGARVVPKVSLPWSLPSCSPSLPSFTTPSSQTSLVTLSLLLLQPPLMVVAQWWRPFGSLPSGAGSGFLESVEVFVFVVQGKGKGKIVVPFFLVFH